MIIKGGHANIYLLVDFYKLKYIYIYLKSYIYVFKLIMVEPDLISSCVKESRFINSTDVVHWSLKSDHGSFIVMEEKESNDVWNQIDQIIVDESIETKYIFFIEKPDNGSRIDKWFQPSAMKFYIIFKTLLPHFNEPLKYSIENIGLFIFNKNIMVIITETFFQKNEVEFKKLFLNGMILQFNDDFLITSCFNIFMVVNKIAIKIFQDFKDSLELIKETTDFQSMDESSRQSSDNTKKENSKSPESFINTYSLDNEEFLNHQGFNLPTIQLNNTFEIYLFFKKFMTIKENEIEIYFNIGFTQFNNSSRPSIEKFNKMLEINQNLIKQCWSVLNQIFSQLLQEYYNDDSKTL
ncbi:hypothetical protein TBLA_0B03290 [Henningerozyma blattae CBS 6284]|uniref:Uncharacterized protein n=1 Tax=Henningerozyma blattae (strain ATCC 34711 / CBS 6284 / DSM 70876 / NBRC 10599 / NRRL Y-10934 / UCD 77-7) TaxID=1071380 RepID=I2GYG8_HENB6|nr:hypothetical protein TBLA_0B03290 [Tetrapisispora blattae CBS 6284]CCH59170.1 hypothetical protein TBLA_0B03290 [Tetrapisispora blattae CBS 6284]